MTTAKEVLNQARRWLGYNEADGSFKVIIDTYNSHKPLARSYALQYDDEWCDGFFSAVGIKAGAVDLLGTEVGVERHIDIFKQKDIWNEDGNIRPRPGDGIIFNWDDASQPNDGWADHIGFVEDVIGNTVVCIEGNMEGEKVGRRYIPIGWGYIRGYVQPKYDEETSVDTPTTEDTSNIIDVVYRVKTQKHGWLDAVLNLNDYAGWQGSPIVGVAMKVIKGKIKYCVHVLGGDWLGWIESYDVNDYYKGWAGNNQPIDAIQIYYYTPEGKPLKEAVYKVNNFDWQHDTDTSNGMDGYAGLFGVPMTKLQVCIKDCD